MNGAPCLAQSSHEWGSLSHTIVLWIGPPVSHDCLINVAPVSHDRFMNEASVSYDSLMNGAPVSHDRIMNGALVSHDHFMNGAPCLASPSHKQPPPHLTRSPHEGFVWENTIPASVTKNNSGFSPHATQGEGIFCQACEVHSRAAHFLALASIKSWLWWSIIEHIFAWFTLPELKRSMTALFPCTGEHHNNEIIM